MNGQGRSPQQTRAKSRMAGDTASTVRCAPLPPPPLPQQPPPITQLSSSLFPQNTLLSSFFFSDTLLDIACGISREWEQGARVWVLSIYSI